MAWGHECGQSHPTVCAAYVQKRGQTYVGDLTSDARAPYVPYIRSTCEYGLLTFYMVPSFVCCELSGDKQDILVSKHGGRNVRTDMLQCRAIDGHWSTDWEHTCGVCSKVLL
ncbi:hypothetical protein Bbelb_077620 [Branchiostoma belcheri]|nr:hypothetical protein Bbelb_077620 [Branchiostoma belcheri]